MIAAGDEPTDVVALFHCTFHTTKGNIIDWSVKALPDLDLEGVEFSCLPSGLHVVEEDIIYFTRQEYHGVCIFRRRDTSEAGQRGARLGALGLLVERSPRPRPWRHLKSLKMLSDGLDDDHADRESLLEYFERHKILSGDVGPRPWAGWDVELKQYPQHPMLHLPHVLRLLGPSSMTFIKHVLSQRRVMIWTHPATEIACLLSTIGVQLCFGSGQDFPTEAPIDLGMVGLNDIGRLESESAKGLGWIACTTDRLFLEKPHLYDLIIDLTTPTESSIRPTLYISRPTLSNRARSKLHAVRFTFSDLRIWYQLERILASESDTGPQVLSDFYESWCVSIAGLWLASSSTGIIMEGDENELGPTSPLHSTAPASTSAMEEPLSLESLESLSKAGLSSRSQRLRITLEIYTVFHSYFDSLHAGTADLIHSKPALDGSLTLLPRDVASLNLNPLSELDNDFCRGLIESKLRSTGVTVALRRSWKDLASLLLGW